ncbi:uncharacterized protein LOC104891205 [Beta vulgaris subsp. vulgaris]|uniref:uncharacterized protein LOC104891205 n=1 Tax=Beta vulgaris subsp. vulgaris TaxID=3555 RepID=UPI0020368859|nr:uncharacterized protein LOC104891205 [Beta vulgaris subsp. vulgaris]XP_057250287.1 uncharacterized protein LOC104891205 [Beta vulgaris subsp. vulgaris]XP_057250288.1 uncharacterized protein LOC104891205 [Beta vulgaris subsp. vulgaris]XP_057250289.1 uncharacterized protein LOC104891205 [Beta vulgaris subsp. vulgaris]
MLANSNTTSWAVSTDNLERGATNSNINVGQPSGSLPMRTFSQGPVAIMWDIENCPVPSDVRPEDVAGNIRMALRVHPVIQGAVTLFSAYGDFNAFPRRVREGCQRTGVKLVDVPNGRKDAADKAILVDMFLFALDNPPPSSIMLISGDVDFAPALHILGQRGYTVILVIPSGVGVSSALCNAGRFVWDWPSVARGEGFVPLPRPNMVPRGGTTDNAGFLMGFHMSENIDGNDEEAIVYRGLSQSFYNSRDFTLVSQSLSEYNASTSAGVPVYTTSLRSNSVPPGLNEVTAGSIAINDQNDSNRWVQVQPGDVNSLKAQLVKLLELSGGCLPLVRVPAEYQKEFGRPLYISEYGACKLVNLLKKMSDVMSVEGKGQKKFVYLRNVRPGSCAPSLPLKRDKKGKGVQEESMEVTVVCGSSDEFSDDERMVIEEQERRSGAEIPTLSTDAQYAHEDQNLLQFKYELEEILVSYSCGIFLSFFEKIYLQRYKKPLDYRKFGVNTLEELFEKLRDVVVLHEDPVSKKKFIAAALG